MKVQMEVVQADGYTTKALKPMWPAIATAVEKISKGKIRRVKIEEEQPTTARRGRHKNKAAVEPSPAETIEE